MLLWSSGRSSPSTTQDFYYGLAEKTKQIAQRCHQLSCSPKREAGERTRRARTPAPPRPRSRTKWYVKQPTWRLWGEERADGVVYTVYLKKVRYHRPPRTASTESDDEISHLEWETERVRFIKAATLERLVDALATPDGDLEPTFVNVFLATYRSFATPRAVLDLLLAAHERRERERDGCAKERDVQAAGTRSPGVQPDNHKKSLVSVLYVWLDTYPEDFRESPQHPALEQLLLFTSNYRSGTDLLRVKVLQKLDAWRRDQDAESRVVEGWGDGAADGAGGVCLAPGMRLTAHHLHTYHFPNIPTKDFAEQFTRMDMELFKKLVPAQCLGAIWSRRDKSRSQDAPTVLATVSQFNAVSYRVVSTLLVEPRLRPNERAQALSVWIDIAQELRILKNFSSLKAIISGLQSNPIYRLQKTWSLVPKEKMELFDELARIFSEDNNQWAQRELLMREGTAKFADTVGQNDKQLQKVFQKHNTRSANISHGTIPYLGTFLTDLTMIDTAIPDTLHGYINFDKRRKEFEVLAQIKLLQGAANAYNLPRDPMFDRWFDSVLVLDEKVANQLSSQIEPQPNKKPTNQPQGHRKNDSIASTSSSNSSQFYCDIDNSTISSKNNSLDRRASPSQMSSGSSNSSIPSLDISLSSANSGNSKSLQVPKGGKQNNQPNILSPNHKQTPDFYIIKVTYESQNPETDGVVLYKSIMLSNNERTPQVIRNAMLKLNLEGNPDSYTLSQILPDKELLLRADANVYYAVNTAFNLNFILRRRTDGDPRTLAQTRASASANERVAKVK